MPAPAHRRNVSSRARIRVAACLSVAITVGLVACVVAATASASADRAGELLGGPTTSSAPALDRGAGRAVIPAALRRYRVSRNLTARRSHAPRAKHGTTEHAAPSGGRDGGTTEHGTDAEGRNGGTTDRDLALAATWQVDPSLLQP